MATAALYSAARMGTNRIGIPTRYYKVIWYPNGITEAYYADNKDTAYVISTTIERVNAEVKLHLPKQYK